MRGRPTRCQPLFRQPLFRLRSAASAAVRSAAELEATTRKHPDTPGALLPPYEA